MTDVLLTRELQQEALSRAYAHAIAAKAGYATSEPHPDLDGVDLEIKSGGNPLDMRAGLDFQLKATTRLRRLADSDLRYDLKVRNYDLLRGPSQTPRLLLILELPNEESEWLSITHEELTLRRCAYWVNLRDAPEPTSATTIAIPVPESNLFTPDTLRDLMEQSRQHGRIIQ